MRTWCWFTTRDSDQSDAFPMIERIFEACEMGGPKRSESLRTNRGVINQT